MENMPSWTYKAFDYECVKSVHFYIHFLQMQILFCKYNCVVIGMSYLILYK
jgi:hypothetical protein